MKIQQEMYLIRWNKIIAHFSPYQFWHPAIFMMCLKFITFYENCFYFIVTWYNKGGKGESHGEIY